MSGLHEKKGTSIQSRLILLLLCVLIPVLAIQAYIYYDNYQDRRGLEFRANLEIARAVAKSFESFVQDVLHQELAIGLAITSSQPMTPRDITRILNSSRDDVAVRDFTWLNPKGDAIYSSSPAMIGINYSDRSYFRDVVNGREWMISELMIAKTTGKPVFGISRGIRNGKGALLGIVFAVIIYKDNFIDYIKRNFLIGLFKCQSCIICRKNNNYFFADIHYFRFRIINRIINKLISANLHAQVFRTLTEGE